MMGKDHAGISMSPGAGHPLASGADSRMNLLVKQARFPLQGVCGIKGSYIFFRTAAEQPVCITLPRVNFLL
jgi:hypothetical protein